MLTTHSNTIIAAYAALSAYLVGLQKPHSWYDNRIRTPVKHWHTKRNKHSYPKHVVPRVAPTQYEPWEHRSNNDKQRILTDFQVLNSHMDNVNITLTPDEVPLVFDTGASCTIVNSIDDFVEKPHPVQSCTIKGTAAGLDIVAVGTVKYNLTTDKGDPITLLIHDALYVPDSPVRLLCPQQIIRQHKHLHTTFTMAEDTAYLKLGKDIINIPLNIQNNLPMITTNPGCECFTAYLTKTYGSAYQCGFLGTTDNEDNEDDARQPNISAKSQRLLRWHRKLNHMHFPRLKTLARQNIIPKDLSNAKTPICAECLYGKQAKRPKQFRGHIKKNDTKPGSCVSGDHMEAGTDGLVQQARGRRAKKRHKVATLWVDHHSDFMYIHTQESTAAEHTIEAKLEFESFAKRYNVHIESYRTDNGTFTAKEFTEAIDDTEQKLTHCGIGAHWQNGIAE